MFYYDGQDIEYVTDPPEKIKKFMFIYEATVKVQNKEVTIVM